MKAFIYAGIDHQTLEFRPKPTIEKPSDAIVRVTKTSICGTDLHIMKGDVPSCLPGRILGHEGVGIIDSVGSAICNFKAGDRVLISCITSCGKCEFCKKMMFSHCTTGGWILGHTIDGTQAEFVRIPYADNSLYPIPSGADEEIILMLSDILPTGFECGVLNGKVHIGNTVAIVGAGPIGMAALLTAQFYSPSQIIVIDLDSARLDMARQFGASATVLSSDIDAQEQVLSLTDGKGVDTAIEAVGLPQTFEFCQAIIAIGGTIANIGVHGHKVDLHLEKLWDQNITITTGLVDTSSTPMLLRAIAAEKICAKELVTHRFAFDQIMSAYETFRDASKTHALKVVISMKSDA